VTYGIEIRLVETDSPVMGIYADMLRQFLYRKNSFDPLSDISKALVVFGAKDERRWIGFAYVSHYASPDLVDNGPGYLWFEDSVVLPEFQMRGVWGQLQKKRLLFAQGIPGRIFSASINQWRTDSLTKRGWVVLRNTFDHQTEEPCTVLELPRDRLAMALGAT
jgi:hypothetical protein